jgi:uncharacterized protein YlxW (UPF0749 family)
MRQIPLTIFFFLVLLAISSSVAQTPDAREQRLLALLKEVQAQEAQIADNQAKIDAKLADLAESIRTARIYSKRER